MLQLTLTQAQNTNNQNMSKWSLGARAGFSLLPDAEDQLQKITKIKNLLANQERRNRFYKK